MVTHGREQSGCSIKRQGQHLWKSEFFFSKQLKPWLLRDVTDRLTPFVMLNG